MSPTPPTTSGFVPIAKRRGENVLSVIVPTCRRTTRLLLTLTALRRQDFPDAEFEVIVVDDAETDSPVREVLAMLPDRTGIEVVRSHGRGVAHARNAGAARAQGELLLFLDDDTVCGEGVLQAHLKAHGDANTAPLVVHGRVTDLSAFRFSPDPPQPALLLSGALSRSIQLADVPLTGTMASKLGPRRSLIEKAAAEASQSQFHTLRWLSCIGTNTSLRREVFDTIGGFDERYSALWGGEDLELGIRLQRFARAEFSLTETSAYHLGLARKNTDESLARFWRMTAEHHGDPGLLVVADFLRGRIDLTELKRRQEAERTPEAWNRAEGIS